MGHRNACRTEPNCSSCVKKKEKKNGRGVGREKKKRFPCRVNFSGDIWRITQSFLGGGGVKNERAEFYRHSGVHRKVTFERTIARLFSLICRYE